MRSVAAMAISSIDILNLSHSLKDICEVDCDTPAGLSQALKFLLQYNLIRANLQFCRQLGQEDCPHGCPPAPICPAPGQTVQMPLPPVPVTESTLDPFKPGPSQATPSPIPQSPPVRLDIGDPFLAAHET